MRHHILVALIVAAFALPLAACKEEGVMEEAGKKIDDAAEELMDSGEGALEKAGRKMDEAIDDTEDEMED